MPPNVFVRRYEYHELRDLYARSSVVAVPLYENDFQAGITTLLEAMAMGKPVIVTHTSGQAEVITDGVNGLSVAPADGEGWHKAIVRLQNDSELRDRLGKNARHWLQTNAPLSHWASTVKNTLYDAVTTRDAAHPGRNNHQPSRSTLEVR